MIRVCEGNTQSLLKVLDLVRALLEVMAEQVRYWTLLGLQIRPMGSPPSS